MDARHQMGLMLIVAGLALIAAGAVVMFAGRLPFLGRLPGDISIHGRNWSFHFPIVTGILLSLILTILLNIFLRR